MTTCRLSHAAAYNSLRIVSSKFRQESHFLPGNFFHVVQMMGFDDHPYMYTRAAGIFKTIGISRIL